MKIYIKGHGILQLIIFGCVAVFPEFAYSSYNIALGKPASQSSVDSGWGANKVVDGVIGKDVEPHGRGSCSSTNPRGSPRDAWWRVDLEHISRIKTINVTYRELYPFRLSGFYLYVSNITAVDNLPSTGHLCYHDNIRDPDVLPSFNQSRPCTVDGRYVIFYNKRPADNGPKYHRYYSNTSAIVELCEVQVYGCPVKMFGPACNITCHCDVGGCDPDNGICDVTGCQSGWMEQSCSTECGPGTFGADCAHTCHCSTPGCNIETGHCTVTECKEGWEGNACDAECGDGRFGQNCIQTCHCALPGCDRFNGSCTITGCESGWTGVACDIACPEKQFGRECKQICHCAVPGCDRFSGQCTRPGCEAGWEGLSCDKACDVGKYGKDCKYNCNCATSGCDANNGKCKVPGCDVGWEGSRCDIACNISSFGNNCYHTCHCAVPGCNRFTGECIVEGCKVGWKGSACDKEATQINSNDSHSTDEKSIGFALLGTLLFISICFNIGQMIDRMRTKRKNLKSEQSDNEMKHQNSLNDNNYDELEASKIGQARNVYDTIAR